MSGVSKIVTDEVLEIAKRQLKELGKDKYIAAKLQAVISTKTHGITKVAEVFNISRPTLFSWIKHVKQNHPERLTVAPGRGRKRKLSAEQTALVKGCIQEDTQLTIDQLQRYIQDELNVSLSRSTTHRLMVSLNFSYITPRPKHYKQDPLEQDDFKKN
jgi:transposase